jgi:hypothetical protein
MVAIGLYMAAVFSAVWQFERSAQVARIDRVREF